MEETKSSAPFKFTVPGFNEIIAVTGFDEIIATKSRAQTVEEYLKDAIDNEMVYKNSPMYIGGILSYENDAPIEIW